MSREIRKSSEPGLLQNQTKKTSQIQGKKKTLGFLQLQLLETA